jgi:hypothetical protein
MPRYQRKAQVLFTKDQYARLGEIAKREGKKLGTLLREAAIQMHLRQARAQEKTRVVRELLALATVPAPDDYEAWERHYLQTKTASHD